MHKKKNEPRDIYQGRRQDLEKDFTPQVAQELLERRRRDLIRSRLLSFFFGFLVIVLSVTLVAIVIRNFLGEWKISGKIGAEETPYIPSYSLPTDFLWVMNYQADAETNTPSGPKPLAVQWVLNAAYHIVMGQQALAVKDPKQALEHFQKTVEIYPHIQGIYRTLGLLHLECKEYAPAVQHLEKALQEEETFDILDNLGTAYIGTEQYHQAETCLLRALELLPGKPGCHRNLAVLYRKMKRDNEAVFQFEKYLDLQPNDFDTLQTYALYLTQLERWKEAADLLTRLTKEVTDIAPIYFLLAQVQVQNGQPEKAVKALQRGIQLIDPELALAWMNREEFNTVRGTEEFETLISQLKRATHFAERTNKVYVVP